MILFATILFLFAALGIAGLFSLKHWEEKHHRVVSPGTRLWGDEKALEAKRFFTWAQLEADKLPPAILSFIRWSVHEFALGFAALARALERQAHRLADLVSHKRNFVQRESTNEFLRQMSEHKNGNGNGVDITR